jgi:hypothetical protein
MVSLIRLQHMDMRSQNFTPIDIASKFLTFSIFASLIELGIQHNVRSSLMADLPHMLHSLSAKSRPQHVE